MTGPAFPLVTTALRVEHPLGIFYIISPTAAVVLDVSHGERLSAKYSPERTKTPSTSPAARGPGSNALPQTAPSASTSR